MVKGVKITMVNGEPTLVFRRAKGYWTALMASQEMGLPLTGPRKVEDEIFKRLKRALTDPDYLEELLNGGPDRPA